MGTPILAKQSIFGGVFSSLAQHLSSPALQFDLRSMESKASFTGAHGFCYVWSAGFVWGEGQVFGWFGFVVVSICVLRDLIAEDDLELLNLLLPPPPKGVLSQVCLETKLDTRPY